MLRKLGIGLLVVIAGVYFWNAPWRAGASTGGVSIISHRGVHQTFDRTDLDNDTCTAERIFPPTHALLENTLPSMRAAFEAGADIVELDVHPTTDGQFAVMHDWTIDCRTEGTGETRSHDMAYLKSLDIGYGYTADGGKTFPFRGQGVGLMPEFKEVLSAFPDRKFLVNFKSNEVREGDMLGEVIAAHPEWRAAVWGAYGGDPPTYRAAERIAGLNVWSRRGLTDCLLQYAAYGWTGIVPAPCRDTSVMLPINIAPFAWGWPDLFVERMKAAGSEVILIGPYTSGDTGTSGIDTPELLAQVPDTFSGYIWTNTIQSIGPLVHDRFK